MPDGTSAASPRRILVTGSREWPSTDVEPIRDALLLYGPGIVVHGNAAGVDKLAAGVASRLRYTDGWPRPEAHAAKWSEFGNFAGCERNQRMVELGADVCLAFPTATSVGTYDCAARAERAGIRVVWFPGEGVSDHTIEACMQHARRRLVEQAWRGRVRGTA